MNRRREHGVAGQELDPQAVNRRRLLQEVHGLGQRTYLFARCLDRGDDPGSSGIRGRGTTSGALPGIHRSRDRHGRPLLPVRLARRHDFGHRLLVPAHV